MTQQEAEQIENELTELIKPKHSDLRTHIDLINGTDEIIISFFWDWISKEKWNGAKSFRLNPEDYKKVLKSEIIPFFN